MVVVVSTFRVANGMEAEVRSAFRDRPRLVDSAAGFLGLEVFTGSEDPATFHLVTRWTDEPSYRSWHGSEQHRESHAWMPKGLKLDAQFTRLMVLDRVEDRMPYDTLAVDAAPLMGAFASTAEALHLAWCDPAGRMRLGNPAFRNLTGASEGAEIWPLLTAGDAAALRERVSSAVRLRDRCLMNFVDGRHSPRTLRCMVDVQPDGFLILGEPVAAAERQMEDELLRLNNEMAVLMRENTRKGKALETANAALLRSNHDLEQFAAAISHDLRSPLAAVSSCVGALAEKAGPQLGKDGEVLCDLIVRGLAHMREMITGLLDYSRASTLDFHVEKVDPRPLIEAVLETLACAINSNGAFIQVGDLPLIAADPIQLRRVFQNLIGNAIQNRRTEPPRILIGAEREGSHWRFSVADNGRGIDPDIAGGIFEPFRRGRTNRYEGTGLGLALCKRVIERHGGRIWVESEPDAGSTFFFTLPHR